MHFSGGEIIAIAVRIEENGHAFYSAAAELFQYPHDCKNLFLDLAEKEVMHIAICQKLAELFKLEIPEISKDEPSDSLYRLSEIHIFGEKDSGLQRIKTIQTPKQALEIAYQFEIDCVSFYTELAKRTRFDSRRLIRQIIQEEKEHAAEIKRFL